MDSENKDEKKNGGRAEERPEKMTLKAKSASGTADTDNAVAGEKKAEDKKGDAIDKRLKESAEACIKSYDEWRKDESDPKACEALREAVHELRKVASRLEIEMAISERGKMSSNPIPIPSHRSSMGDRGINIGNNGNGNGDIAAGGNGQNGNNRGKGGRRNQSNRGRNRTSRK